MKFRLSVHRLNTFGPFLLSSEVGVYAYSAAQVKKAMEVSAYVDNFAKNG